MRRPKLADGAAPPSPSQRTGAQAGPHEGPDAGGRGAAPRWRTIAQSLLADISDDAFPVGSMLPSEAELSERFGASRFTIREALRWLSEHGVIERRRGAGTVVRTSRPETAFVFRLSSMTEILKYPSNTHRENLFAGRIHADPELASQIDCPVGAEWFRMSGLRRTDVSDKPICWSDIYVLPEFEALIREQDNGREPIFELLERMAGVSILNAEIRMFASSIDGKLAKLMEVAEGTPALTIVRRYTSNDGRFFEATVTVHPEKRFEYSMQLQRDRVQNEPSSE